MPRRVERTQTDALEIDRVAVAVADPHRDHVDRRLAAHDGDALRPVAKRPHCAHMVGMDMGIQDLGQREVELGKESQAALDLLQHRADDEGFTARAAGNEVGVAAGADVVALAKEHRPSRTAASLTTPPL